MSKHTLSFQEQLEAKLNGVGNRQNQRQPYLEQEENERVFDNRENRNSNNSDDNAASFPWPDKFTEEQRILIGIEIADARERLKMTQGKLSSLSNIPVQEIIRVEKGRVVRLDKATIKKFGRYLNKDFNKEIAWICEDQSKKKEKAIVASSEGKALVFDDEHTIKIKGHNFLFKCTVSEYDFKLILQSPDLIDETVIYQGKKANDAAFIEALTAMAKRVGKSL